MLASRYRLSDSKEIEKVKKEGRLYKRKNFGVVVLRKNPKILSKFAFIVSTKISKHSTLRNRIKRALGESVRHHLYLIGKGYDMVFLPKTRIAKKTTEEIMREVKIFVTEFVKTENT